MNGRPLDPLRVPLEGTSLIEASAGTGKTYAITTLFVRLMLERELDVDRILVTTFTEAATAELRARVRERLREALETCESGRPGPSGALNELVRARTEAGLAEADRRRLRAALGAVDGAAIFTIHGFCRRMLMENAFESGVDFDTELVADLGPLLAGCVHDFWAQRICGVAPELARHLHEEKTLSPQTLLELAARVARCSDVPVLPASLAPPLRLDGPQDLELAVHALEVEFAAFVRRRLPERKREVHRQSFEDLLVGVRDALRRDDGGALAARILERYPVALIDEFQDTDPVQYEIFRRLYHQRGAALFLIGDPKQAIYSFRGADVFAYIAAVGDAGEQHYTLATNYRSDAPLVTAVNTLFGRVREPFVLGEIGFSAVEAHWDAARLVDRQREGRRLEILFLPRAGLVGSKTPSITKENARAVVPHLLAGQIAGLLRSDITVEGKPLHPGHVAVLCRTNEQAALCEAALRRAGVPAVRQGEASVFDAPEAEDLQRIALALAEPERAAALKAALVSPTLGATLSELRALQDDPRRWEEESDRFRRWNEAWERQGFLQALRRMLGEAGVEARLLRHHDGERRLTNLLHLAELMQAAAVADHLGPRATCEWLQRMRADETLRGEAVGDSAELRLESDERAVRVVTIHKSKGLEYPLVFCPDLWGGGLLQRNQQRWLEFHDRERGYLRAIDVASPDRALHRQWAESEAMSENMRVLYVALTRARHRCAVVWGAFNDAGASSLAYALHQGDPADGDGGEELWRRTRTRYGRLQDDEALMADLRSLVESSGATIGITRLDPHERVERYRGDARARPRLAARTAPHRPGAGWRMSSFSALTAAHIDLLHPAAEGVDLDATAAATTIDEARRDDSGAPQPSGEAAAGAAVLLGGAGRGTAFGRFVHKIFELLDFERADAGVIADLARAVAARSYREIGTVDDVAAAIAHVLDTPLEQVAPGFALRGIARGQRLNEMEFHFPVAPQPQSAAAASAALSGQALGEAFARHGTREDVRAYAARLGRLDFAPLRGFLKGIVDLVFVHEGRWFVVDYKSNHLGALAGDYHPSRLATAMAEHHYYLQYHLYTLALHRHLRRHLAGYDYRRHLGGALYLFVRGMSPGAEPGSGVYFDCPPPSLIEALDALMEGTAAVPAEVRP